MRKVLIFIILIVIAYYFVNKTYLNTIESSVGIENDVNFSIEAGQGVKEIVSSLKKSGIISNENILKYYIWKNKFDKKIQAGDYLISKDDTIKNIVKKFIAGNVQNREREIKIIEGWRIDDIDQYLAMESLTELGEFKKLANKKIKDWPFEFEKPSYLSLLPNDSDFEGLFFPDTYRIFIDVSLDDIVEKLMNEYDEKITDDYVEKAEKQYGSLYKAIIMASIIQKEVRSSQDMKVVSGILNKRLEIGMKLEVDATINYITKKKNPSSTYSDLQIDSPYNTYKYYGLPPGPISNPGLDALTAAIEPTATDYLFYLNRQDTDSKETIFSKTYDEHLRNKAKYLK